MAEIEDVWVASVCYDAKSIAAVLREVLEELGFVFSREKSEKHYTKVMLVVPLPRFAYVFRFRITKPSEFTIDLYDTYPTHGGVLHFIAVSGITESNMKDVRRVVQRVAAKLPRKPWKFFWGERLRSGILIPEYLKSRRAWNRMGVT
jgi:8-oxo-dGTP pyrophosphatase MutT (NUDIX family)